MKKMATNNRLMKTKHASIERLPKNVATMEVKDF